MTYQPPTVKTIYDLDTVLTFGVYKGLMLKDVDGGYLIWMIDTFTNADFTESVQDLAQEYMDSGAN